VLLLSGYKRLGRGSIVQQKGGSRQQQQDDERRDGFFLVLVRKNFFVPSTVRIFPPRFSR
jgi:hypothetical protein